MDNPKISVIVPVYNVEQYLPRCIDNILVQTFTDFEVLLIDDGSTDNSGDICDEYAKKDNRIRVFHKKNGGVSSARNLGLNNAIGKWIAFIDADDYIGREYLSLFFKYNPKEDIYTQIIQGFHVTDNKGEIDQDAFQNVKYENTIVIKGIPNHYFQKHKLLKRWEIWARIFSLQIIQENKISFNEDIHIYEDGVFWHTYICKIQKLHYIREREYYYYSPLCHASISTSKKSIQETIDLINIYQHLSLKLISEFKIEDKYAYEIYGLYYFKYKEILLHRLNLLTLKQQQQFKELSPVRILYKKTIKDYIFAFINKIPLSILFKLSSHHANSILI